MASGGQGTQKIELPFTGGLAQQYHPHHAPMGNALQARNVRYTRDGGIDKRPGCTSIGSLPTVFGKLLSRQSELVAVDDYGKVYSYAPDTASSGTVMVAKGTEANNACAVLTRSGVFATASEPAYPDYAYGGGLEVHVWNEGLGGVIRSIVYSVRSASTGAESSYGRLDASGVKPRVIYVSGGTPSGQFVITWNNGANIKAVAFSASTHAVTAGPTTVVSDNRSNGDYDICPMSDRWAIAYQTSTTTASKVRTFSNALVAIGSLTVDDTLAVNKTGWSIDATNDESIWVGHVLTSGGTNYAISWCVNPATFLNRAGFPYTVASSATYLYSQTNIKRRSSSTCTFGIAGYAPAGGSTIGAPFITCPLITNAGAVSGSASPANRLTYWCMFASKPFVAPDGSTQALIYKAPATTTNLRTASLATLAAHSASFVLADLRQGDTTSTNAQALPVGQPVCARTAFVEYSCPPPSSCVSVGTGKFVTSVRERRSNDGRTSITRVHVDFASTDRFVGADVFGSLHYAPGGCYDGQYATEIGFIDGPQYITATPVGGGGSLAANTYAWCVHYTDLDRNGNVAKSQVCQPIGATCVANDSVTLTVPYQTFTRRQIHDGANELRRQVRVDIYRTTAGGTVAGPFYFCRSLVVNTPALNDPRSAAVSITDGDADSALSGQPFVYTTGGVLGNVSPPSLRHLVSYRGRLVGVGDDGRTCWFSKAFVEGDQPGWCDAFTLPPIDDSETITALCVLDERLIAFTRSRVYWTAFDGPPDTGGASDVGPWRRVAADVGCIDSRSVAVFQGGVLFQSSVGLQLMDRGLSVQQPTFGLAVQTELASYPIVWGTLVHPSDGVIYIHVGTTTPDTEGRRIVYDYTSGRWSTDRILDSLGSASTGHPANAIAIDGTVYWTGSGDGKVYQEYAPTHASAYLDSGAFVPRIYETAWIHPSGLQGWMTAVKWLLLTQRYTSYGVTVELFEDFNETAIETWTFGYAAVDTLADTQWSQAIPVHKSQAYKLRITETAPSTLGNGRGAEWVSLALELEGLDRSAKFATTNRG